MARQARPPRNLATAPASTGLPHPRWPNLTVLGLVVDDQFTEPLVLTLDDRSPTIDSRAWLAPTAAVIGAATVAAGASIWYGAVVRADDEEMSIGGNSNVQDGAVLHADPGYPCRVGFGVTIGHGAVVHGARIGDGSLVGMGSKLLNGSSIGERCLVAAGSMIPEGFTSPNEVLIVGAPAKVHRPLTADEIRMLARGAGEYVTSAQKHRRCLAEQRSR